MRKTRHSAFSLIELIVVLLIMGTVGSVVVACFMGGVRAYERARDFGRGEADACLAFELLERDLKNAVAVPGISFEGNLSNLRFATMTTAPGAVLDDEIAIQVVEYGERGGDGIVRLVELLGESPSEPDRGESILAGDSAMLLGYYGSDEGQDQSTWVGIWQSTSNLPQQVRIRFSGGELEPVELERTIIIPVAGGDDE
jgi:prepilin-type N-terminal cleavage/methylation domain-containing protein